MDYMYSQEFVAVLDDDTGMLSIHTPSAMDTVLQADYLGDRARVVGANGDVDNREARQSGVICRRGLVRGHERGEHDTRECVGDGGRVIRVELGERDVEAVVVREEERRRAVRRRRDEARVRDRDVRRAEVLLARQRDGDGRIDGRVRGADAEHGERDDGERRIRRRARRDELRWSGGVRIMHRATYDERTHRQARTRR